MDDLHPSQAAALARNPLCATSLIGLALAHDAKFVFVSSLEVCTARVAPEPGGHGCEEARRFDEAAVAAAHRKKGLDARIVRLFNCYGPRMQSADGSVLLPFVEAALNRRPLPIAGDGNQSMAMTYVDDAIRLLMLITEEPQLVFEPIHAGSDDDRAVAEIARLFAASAGLEFCSTAQAPGSRELPHRERDFSYAHSLGWRPETSLEDGVRKTFDWFARVSRQFV
jgi:dTDP-glucose 4,6-dehydratase